MKGKYANLAEKRQAMTALEDRAAAAERALDKAEAEFRGYRERTSAELSALRERVRAITAERDAGEGPAVRLCRAQQEQLTDELREQRANYESEQKLRVTMTRGVLDLLMAAGATYRDAMELIINFVPGKQALTRITGEEHALAGLSQEQALALQAARRQRATDSSGFLQAMLARRDELLARKEDSR